LSYRTPADAYADRPFLLLPFDAESPPSFASARATLQGIELMHAITKGQMRAPHGLSAAEPFYSLAA
jgi:hypothetical protein